MNKPLVLGVGNLYVETNYLGVKTDGKEELRVGLEYSAPEYETHLGGSAVNFVSQVYKLGLDVGIIGKCGTDETGRTLIQMLEKAGVKTDLVKKSPELQTNVDTGLVFENSGQNIQIVAGNANQSLKPEDIDFESPLVKKASAIYFGGGFKQKYLWPHYPSVFKKLKKNGLKLFLDPGRVPVDADEKWVMILKDVLPFCDGYFPNETELQTVTKTHDYQKALEVALSWGASMVVLKLGPNGAIVKTNGESLRVPGIKVSAINTVGAGDCFNAAFISQILQGKTLNEAINFANAAAAYRVSKNVQPNMEDVQKFLISH